MTGKVAGGSLFSIFFPVCERAIVPAGGTVLEEHEITAGTVLVVDDEPMLCEMFNAWQAKNELFEDRKIIIVRNTQGGL